ncbi:unnamed protein product [marine sediment metagenome]|uniref:Glycosyltransferase 2-like domain-containing protein n=1 Tax=marine sediment metagenome TaxID=412755 RepID=X1H8U5_9ZZZZ
MSDVLPSISFVIPTFNSERVLDKCLKSIRIQHYPADKIEIIIVDAGSTDKTLEIAHQFKVDKILGNPLKTGEAGKAIGIDASEGEIIAFVDSDNLLESEDWLKKMVKPFENLRIISSEVLFWTYRRQDSLVDRYCALTGINDPICLFLGNYDRYSYLTGKWSEMPVIREVDKGEYLDVILDEHNVPTMGANGYLIRKKVVKMVNYTPYYFDVDVVYQLTQIGYNQVARVKVGIIHLFCDSTRSYIRKQKRRINDYLYFKRKGQRIYQYNLKSFKFAKFLVFTLLVFPLFGQAFIGYSKKPDVAWFFHPLACWITLTIYIFGILQSLFKVRLEDRSTWKG